MMHVLSLLLYTTLFKRITGDVFKMFSSRKGLIVFTSYYSCGQED